MIRPAVPVEAKKNGSAESPARFPLAAVFGGEFSVVADERSSIHPVKTIADVCAAAWFSSTVVFEKFDHPLFDLTHVIRSVVHCSV